MSDPWPDEFPSVDIPGIRRRIGEPSAGVYDKIIDHLDANCQAFLAHSPFCCLATTDADGNCDCSPRGDYPGFVRILDARTLVIPDRLGNKLADSMVNIVQTKKIGMLCFVPGMTETLRINGTADVTDDSSLLAMLEQDNAVPHLAIVVRTEQVYLHCGRALLRAGLWDAEMQDLAAEVPDSGQIWASTSGLDAAGEQELNSYVDDVYRTLY